MLGQPEPREGVVRRVDAVGPTGPVPGVLHTPASRSGDLPVVLLGHGGGSGKDDPRWQTIGRFLAAEIPAAVLCIDGPFHGERAMSGSGDAGRMIRRALADPATATNLAGDWSASLAEIGSLDGLDVDRLGYFGFSMGTMLGVPVCADLGVGAAVFAGGGVFDVAVVSRFITETDPVLVEDEVRQFETRSRLLVDAASRLRTAEILQLVMLDDQVFTLDGALELFGALAGPKRLAAWPGGHDDLPDEALELAAWFLGNALGRSPSTRGGDTW